MRKEIKFVKNILSTSQMKNSKKSLLTLTNGLKSSTEKINFWPKLKKTSLTLTLTSESVYGSQLFHCKLLLSPRSDLVLINS
jgi:hypothetical protein